MYDRDILMIQVCENTSISNWKLWLRSLRQRTEENKSYLVAMANIEMDILCFLTDRSSFDGSQPFYYSFGE